MHGEVPTIDLLNKLFNPHPAELRPKLYCKKCHGTGLWWQLEKSKLDPSLKVLMSYRCACQKQGDRLNGR